MLGVKGDTLLASLILGIYGAVLSTVLAVLHWQRDKGKFVINPQELHINMSGEVIVWRIVEVINGGRRPLYLQNIGITLNDGNSISLGDKELPIKLDEGQKHTSYIDDKYPSHQIKELWASDSVGRVYRSGKFPLAHKNA